MAKTNSDPFTDLCPLRQVVSSTFLPHACLGVKTFNYQMLPAPSWIDGDFRESQRVS